MKEAVRPAGRLTPPSARHLMTASHEAVVISLAGRPPQMELHSGRMARKTRGTDSQQIALTEANVNIAGFTGFNDQPSLGASGGGGVGGDAGVFQAAS